MMTALERDVSAILSLLHRSHTFGSLGVDYCSDALSGFPSAPNLTAAAAAQNLTWAPVAVTSVEVITYTVVMTSADSAMTTLYLTAVLAVSGDITKVAPDADVQSNSRRLLADSAGELGWGLIVFKQLMAGTM